MRLAIILYVIYTAACFGTKPDLCNLILADFGSLNVSIVPLTSIPPQGSVTVDVASGVDLEAAKQYHEQFGTFLKGQGEINSDLFSATYYKKIWRISRPRKGPLDASPDVAEALNPINGLGREMYSLIGPALPENLYLNILVFHWRPAGAPKIISDQGHEDPGIFAGVLDLMSEHTRVGDENTPKAAIRILSGSDRVGRGTLHGSTRTGTPDYGKLQVLSVYEQRPKQP